MNFCSFFFLSLYFFFHQSPMSTRHARTADKAQNDKNTAILKGLLQQPGNKYCADCKRKGKKMTDCEGSIHRHHTQSSVPNLL